MITKEEFKAVCLELGMTQYDVDGRSFYLGKVYAHLDGRGSPDARHEYTARASALVPNHMGFPVWVRRRDRISSKKLRADLKELLEAYETAHNRMD